MSCTLNGSQGTGFGILEANQTSIKLQHSAFSLRMRPLPPPSFSSRNLVTLLGTRRELAGVRRSDRLKAITWCILIRVAVTSARLKELRAARVYSWQLVNGRLGHQIEATRWRRRYILPSRRTPYRARQSLVLLFGRNSRAKHVNSWRFRSGPSAFWHCLGSIGQLLVPVAECNSVTFTFVICTKMINKSGRDRISPPRRIWSGRGLRIRITSKL